MAQILWDLDTMRIGVLRACLGDLDRVVPHLSDPDEAAYYRGLRELAVGVLEAQRSRQ